MWRSAWRPLQKVMFIAFLQVLRSGVAAKGRGVGVGSPCGHKR